MNIEIRSLVLPLLAMTMAAASPAMARTTLEDGHKAPGTNYRTSNQGLRVGDDAEVGDLSAINGAIRVGEGTVMQDVSSVNGSIQIGDRSRAASVESVNGGIRLGQDAAVDDYIKSVNGSIQLGRGVDAAGDLSTVNGGMELEGARVGGNIETKNGDIRLEGNTEIMGDLVVHKSKSDFWRKSKSNRIYIGPGVTIHGDLYFEKEVSLRVDPAARIGKIHGQEFVTDESF